MNPFTFKGTDPAARCVEFVPDFWEDKGWKVESIKRPALVHLLMSCIHILTVLTITKSSFNSRYG